MDSDPGGRCVVTRHAVTVTRSCDPAGVSQVNEPDGNAPELLTAGEVCRLLHIARSTLPLWRARGDLRGYKGANGHWRYPSNQEAIETARAALRVVR